MPSTAEVHGSDDMPWTGGAKPKRPAHKSDYRTREGSAESRTPAEKNVTMPQEGAAESWKPAQNSDTMQQPGGAESSKPAQNSDTMQRAFGTACRISSQNIVTMLRDKLRAEASDVGHNSDGMLQEEDSTELLELEKCLYVHFTESALFIAVEEGDEIRVREALAEGVDANITVSTVGGGSFCLVAVAARHGHAHLLPCLLEAGLSVDGRGSHDTTPLMEAAMEGHTRTVMELLDRGADPLAADNEGWTTLHWASLWGETECVSTLCSVISPSPELLGAADAHTPVHLASFAGHVAVVKVLEEGGWPLFTLDSDGLTPLHWAVKGGRVDMAKYLFNVDMQLKRRDSGEVTPLDFAIKDGNDLAVGYLTRRSVTVHTEAIHSLQPKATSSAEVNAVGRNSGETLRVEDLTKLLGSRKWLIDKFKNEVLFTAVKEGDEVKVREALAVGGDAKTTVPGFGSWCLVTVAAGLGHAHLLPCLLEAGLSVERRSSHDMTPLMVASMMGKTETVMELMDHGADPLAADDRGWTALHWASLRGKAECVSLLSLFISPSPEVLGAADTLVHLASFAGHLAVVKALDECGWPLYSLDSECLTPLHWAVKGGHVNIVKYLLNKDVQPKRKDCGEVTRLEFAMKDGRDLAGRYLARRSLAVHTEAAQSLQCKAEVDAVGHKSDETLQANSLTTLLGFREWLVDEFKNEMLTTAVKVGDEVRVREALAMGGDPKMTVPVVGGRSWCLLALAASQGHAHLLSCLLEQGLSVEGCDSHNITPLMVAAMDGHTLTLKTLLDRGADPLAADNKGWTSLHWASLMGKLECVLTLIPVISPSPEVLEAADAHTPMHLASFAGHVAVLKTLEERGWPLYALDSDDMTPLHWAVKGGHVNIVKYLLNKYVQPKRKESGEVTPLESAVKDAKDLAERYLARISVAVHTEATHRLQPKVMSNVEEDSLGHNGDETLLAQDLRKLLGFREWLVAEFKNKMLITAVEEGDEVRVREAIARGGDPKVTTPTATDVSCCLVALAAYRGHTHLLPCLLEKGLSVEGNVDRYVTPMMRAAMMGHTETVNALLDLGADPLATDLRGWTALTYAVRWGHVDCFSALVNISSLYTRDTDGRTLLHIAVEGGHRKLVEHLVDKDEALLAERDSSGSTPEDEAVKHGKHFVEEWLVKRKDAVHMGTEDCLRLMQRK